MLQIESKIEVFLNKYEQNIKEYQESIGSLKGVQKDLSEYLNQVKDVVKEIEGGYSSYIKKRLMRRSR